MEVKAIAEATNDYHQACFDRSQFSSVRECAPIAFRNSSKMFQ
jgi:hypothetical protein